MLLWGAAAAALYLAAGAYVWTRVPVRLLYEGEAPPPPYRWVRPPANLPEPNQPPETGTGTIPLAPAGSQSASVLTDDGQSAVIFRFGAIVPRAGAASVQVSIIPLDPATIAPPPPGLRFDGNAYRMEATYPDGTPISLAQPVTVVLRYPRHATMLLRSTGNGWSRLDAHVVAGALQIFASTDRLGVFISAAPVTSQSTAWWGYIAGGAAVLGVLAAIAARWLGRRRRAGATNRETR
jgi:hypothetical protein